MNQAIQRLATKFFVHALIILALSISILPDVYRLKMTPNGTTFPLIHNHPGDYFSYLSYMHTGTQGKWKVTNRVTSEYFEPQFVYTVFILLGFLGKITNISLPWVYFFARIVFGGVLLYVCYLAICMLFKKNIYRAIGCILVFFSTGFWFFVNTNGVLSPRQFLTFWTRFDPVARTTFLPHHVLATLLGLLSLILLVKAISQSRLKLAVCAGIIGFLAGLNYHGTMTNILGGLAIATVIYTFSALAQKYRNSFKKLLLPDILFIFIYICISAISLLYIISLTFSAWPFTRSSNFENQFSFPLTFVDYIGALGPTLILTVIGLRRMFLAKSLFAVILLGWALFPFIGIFYLVNLFPQWSNMPYFEATSYIPLGILAVFGLQEIAALFKQRAKKTLIILTVILLIYFIPAYYDSLQNSLVAVPQFYYNRYIPIPIIEAMTWLDKNSQYQSTVLSGGLFGSIIPAYSHNYIVYGDDVNTYKATEKVTDILAFFAQSDTTLASNILKKYAVEYVFYSMDTDPPKKEFIDKLPLTLVFSNTGATIFEVN